MSILPRKSLSRKVVPLRFRSLAEFVEAGSEFGEVPPPVRDCGKPSVFRECPYPDEAPELPDHLAADPFADEDAAWLAEIGYPSVLDEMERIWRDGSIGGVNKRR